jgi:hypothetical protein
VCLNQCVFLCGTHRSIVERSHRDTRNNTVQSRLLAHALATCVLLARTPRCDRHGTGSIQHVYDGPLVGCISSCCDQCILHPGGIPGHLAGHPPSQMPPRPRPPRRSVLHSPYHLRWESHVESGSRASEAPSDRLSGCAQGIVCCPLPLFVVAGRHSYRHSSGVHAQQQKVRLGILLLLCITCEIGVGRGDDVEIVVAR